MIAMIGRYLHQPIDQVERWDYVDFRAYYEAAGVVLEQERPPDAT